MCSAPHRRNPAAPGPWTVTASVTDRNGLKRAFSYDSEGRQTEETWYATDGTTVVDTLSYTYTVEGWLATAGSAQGTYGFTYDALGQVQTVEDVWGLTLSFTYDDYGNRIRVEDGLGGVEVSWYDESGRLAWRTLEMPSTTPIHVSFLYNAEGLLEEVYRYEGAFGPYPLTARTLYTYDASGRLAGIVHEDGASNVLAEYEYTWDEAGQLVEVSEDGDPTGYGYDDQGQLTGDGTHEYSYDEAGNRDSTGYVIGAGNQILSDGVWDYSYDAEGNLVKKEHIASGETWTYGYDHRNRLIWVERRATDGGTLQMRAEYDYDVFGNRTEKRVDVDGDGTEDFTQRYAHDGFNPAKPTPVGSENWDVWADLDGSGTPTTRYLRGDVVDQVFGRLDGDGAGG